MSCTRAHGFCEHEGPVPGSFRELVKGDPKYSPAADSPGLGAVISERGRETIAPLIGRVMERARAEGALRFDTTTDAVGLYLNLLVGDLQIRRVIAPLPPMEETEFNWRAGHAYSQFLTLCAAVEPSGRVDGDAGADRI
ncbi:hypothetical protein [Hoeflea halophila]|uniref:hypothetical protein n=1 Tax=Hoeflea halophila TaxID=714899 RepID=UPI000BE3F52B|nr:hypothetical protein [Hoeflea halophila]